METKHNNYVHSFLSLRKTIGFIGMLFPLALWLGNTLIFENGLRASISDYYHSGMRDLFVGSLCAIGLFLFFYKGYDGLFGHDDIAGHLAGALALGVAFVPTPHISHYVFAVVLFLTLAYISVFRFTKTNPSIPKTPGKRIRNLIYIICGIVMILSLLVVLFSYKGWIFSSVDHMMYWGEVVALFAFGLSWLVKGNFFADLDLLKD